MPKLLPLLAFCAACSPSAADDAAPPAPRAYGTQTGAPSPDYRALMANSAAGGHGWTRREATSPPPPDAKAIGEAWIARLERRDALLGYGLAGKGPDGPVTMIDTGLTEPEFERWAKENGWSVPTHIAWSFVPALTLPPVAEGARNGIRVWPASTARTGPQNEALFYGRVELRNGCFFVGAHGRPADRLAWFHAEIGLDVDRDGYFTFRDRVSGQTLARLGEEMAWGGPATAVIGAEAERALRDACGPGEILVVGSPESRERFHSRHPHLRDPQPPPPPPPGRR